MENGNNNFSKMEPKDFDLLVMPIKIEDDELPPPKGKGLNENHENIMENIMAPVEYIKELEDRNNYYGNLKVSIGKSGLSN
jgi:hypothetical protein